MARRIVIVGGGAAGMGAAGGVKAVDPEAEVVGGRYGTKLYPETWIIDKGGIIRARFDGGRDWSDSLAVDIAEMVSKPFGCPVEFAKGRPKGKYAFVCSDDS